MLMTRFAYYRIVMSWIFLFIYIMRPDIDDRIFIGIRFPGITERDWRYSKFIKIFSKALSFSKESHHFYIERSTGTIF